MKARIHQVRSMSSTAYARERTHRLTFCENHFRLTESDLRSKESAMPTLAEELRRLRELRDWSLRQVEERTDGKVSNSYLSQLESGIVKEPSPNVLYALAKAYGVPYSSFMSLAGYIVPRAHGNSRAGTHSVAFNAMNLSPKEEQDVLDFIQFRRKRKPRRDS